jgi:hypothetical protein
MSGILRAVFRSWRVQGRADMGVHSTLGSALPRFRLTYKA